MMETLKQLEDQIMVSLFLSPANLSDLMKRDFLQYISDVNVDRILVRLENEGLIFYRGDEIFTYKKTAKNRLVKYELL